MTEQDLSKSRRDSLRQRLQSGRTDRVVPVPRGAEVDRLPLTHAQRRLWFIDRLVPGSTTYNVPVAYRMRGELRVDAVSGAIADVADRHEALRTRFAQSGGEPFQIVDPGPMTVAYMDVSDSPDPEAAARERAVAQVDRPFDLARGPLFRAEVVRLGVDDHVLLLTAHHAVFDGWSLVVLTEELAAAYQARAAGRTLDRAPLTFQFADYAIWQHAQEDATTAAAQVAHWRSALAGTNTTLELPTDHRRPPVPSGKAADVSFTLPAAVVRSLRTLADERRATIFMATLAVYGVLLSRLADLDDLLIATPVYGRPLAELRDLIGFFANTLPFRVDVRADPTFTELLDQLRNTSIDAFAHQDVPFERVVEALDPPRDLSRNSVVQVMFSLLSTGTGVERGEFALPGLDVCEFVSGEVTTRFDVEMHLYETPDDVIEGRIIYATDLFEPPTMERFAAQFEALLLGAVQNPDRRVSTLEVISAPERSLVLDHWGRGPNVPEADVTTVAEWVERVVDANPDAIAVTCDQRQLTYVELNAAANRLARHLCTFGVGPEWVVGLCLPRGIDAVVTTLAVMKAGAAYVPLDPTDPADRLSFLYRDAGARIVVTDATGRASAPALEADVVNLDDVRELLAGYSVHNLPQRADLDSLLYLVYTSGSTGRPKAIVMDNRSKLNMMAWSSSVYEPRPRMLQYYSINPDTYLLEIMLAWWTGGTLIVVPEDVRRDVPALAALIRTERVTTAILPTAVLEHLAQHAVDHPADAVTLRQVATTGDRQRLSPAIRTMFTALPNTTLDNHYGQTEANVVTFNRLSAPASDWPADGPMGAPIQNLQIYVLDASLSPVPIGIYGDVYVAGAGLSRGYRGRPDLTAAAYLPNPFATTPGARMYCTGDRAQWRPNGTLEFLGRADFQFKIRGYRIEPGEIEASMAAVAGVGAAVVICDRSVENDPRLVGYVQPRGDRRIDVTTIQAKLRESLPEYLVPPVIHIVDPFPRTASGKVDRTALLDLKLEIVQEDTEPFTESEKAIAAVWSDVLGVERIGRGDNFFSLGGHSLLVTRVIYRLREFLGVELPLRTLFEAPTVAALAAEIDTVMAPRTVELRSVSRTGRLPLSRAQQRLWFLDQAIPDSPLYNNMLSLRIGGPLDVAKLTYALTRIEARHESLRTRFPEEDGTPIQMISAPRVGSVDLDVHDLRTVPPTEREDAALAVFGAEQLRPFDLADGPLVRYLLIQLDADDHVLGVMLHHAISDPGTSAVLQREIAHYYAMAGDPMVPDLKPLTIQYADYAVWQEARGRSGTYDKQLAYWRDQLAGAPLELELISDRSRPADPINRYRDGQVTNFVLDRELTARLDELTRVTNGTLFMTTLAAFGVLMSWYSRDGQRDIVIGVPVDVRSEPVLEGVIGLFINSLPLRVRHEPSTTFRELLRQVRETNLGAYSNQDLPFERLVEELAPRRDIAVNPIFQVLFQLQYAPAAGEWIPGLSVEIYHGVTPPAKVDIALSLVYVDGELTGNISYPGALFEPAMIDEMVADYRHLLDAVTSKPDLPIDGVASRAGVEVPDSWQGAIRDVPETADTLPHAFRSQVHRTPDAIAIRSGDSMLTYAELDRRSDALAVRLRAAGVGATSAEMPVAVLMDRSPDVVVATLAVVKAGGFYVPLHVTHPDARLDGVMALTGAPVLVIDEANASRGVGQGATIVRGDIVDGSWDDIAPDEGTCPDHLAYVMYTSGSTGDPKGVAISHRDVLQLVHDRCWSSAGRTRVLMHAAYAFDVSTLEIWVPLLSGGEIVVAPAGDLDVDRLAAVIARERVTAVHLTAGLFGVLAEEYPESLIGVAEVQTGGDVVSPGAVRRLLERSPGTVVHHSYGPTEITLCATYQLITDPAAADRPLPIGRPLDNTRAYVLDDQLRPSPVGVAGELYLAGAGLARGYLHRPDLTAERFVADVFGPPGARMYRTGDLARWRRDGQIDFIGRADAQVKIRGYRVEPAEIETAVATRPGVSQAVVVIREDVAGDKRIAAYAVPLAGVVLDTRDLRRQLAEVLPDYMVPTDVVLLEVLPITSNGKVDRAALPEPVRAEQRGTRAGTLREELVEGVVAELLGVDSVGRDANFFELGGHSLLAARLVSRCRRLFGAGLTIGDVFRHPTVAGLAHCLDQASTARPPVTHQVPASDGVPLSYGQQRLWLMTQIEGPSATYNMPTVLRLRGELDRAALAQALLDVITRHPALRTLIDVSDDRMAQVVIDGAALGELPVIDVRADALNEAVVVAAAYHFDLTAEIPTRASLFRVADDDHTLLLLIHHIAGDGWSMGIIMRDLARAYNARRAGSPLEWPAPAVDYCDYTRWQRIVLGDESTPTELFTGQVDYWKQQLAGAPDELTYAGARPRPRIAETAGAFCEMEVGTELHRALKAIAQRTGTTLFMVLQAGLAAVLTRLGSGTDVLIGTPVAGRADEALDEVVGFFVNTLVLRNDVTGDPTFLELLERVRRTDLDAFSHQDVPFERLVEALNPARSASRHPLFQVLLALESGDPSVPAMAGLQVELGNVDLAVSKFDLSVDFVETFTDDGQPAGMHGSIEYAIGLFDAETVHALADRLVAMLRAAADVPELPISRASILDRATVTEIVRTWNSTTRPYERLTLPALFERQAARTPDRAAVVRGGETLTFEEVNKRANRLAHELIDRGAAPGQVVALAIGRSADMIVALLGALKSGAAYAPIDPRYPADRVAAILTDLRPAVLIATADRLDGLGDADAMRIDDVDVAARIRQRPDTDPTDADRRATLRPEHTAYLIHTSGSAGRPKGVSVAHRSVVNLFQVHREQVIDPAVEAASGRRMRAAFTDEISFDASWGTLVWLFAGHELHVIADELRHDPQRLIAYAAEHAIDLFNTTPSYIKQLLLAGLAGEGYQPTVITLGGETVTDSLWAELAAMRTVCHNFYGPTEFTVDALRATIVDGVRPTIGKPLPNARVFVLGPSLEVLPPRVTGELYLAGEQLALGYFQQPENTAERFIANPFGPGGSRMYRTGDLVAWTPDGYLEFVGRVDSQVKIRGFRVELGEIESVLREHASLGQVAVIVREDRPGDRRIVAYVVPRDGATVDAASVRDHVAAALPDYMMPSVVIAVDVLPLNSNGKLDLRALPAPDLGATEAYVPPRTATEEVLCDLFADVLDVASVGVTDNFFERGGHSLMSIRLVSRIRRQFGIEIGIQTLFEAPTVERLAGAVDSGRGSGSGLDVLLSLRAARTGSTRAPLFCIHPAIGISWVYTGLLRHLDPDQPVYGLQARGLTEPDRSATSLAEMVEDYLVQIRITAPHGPYALLGWSFGGLVAHAVAARLRADGESVALLALLDSYPPVPGPVVAPLTYDDPVAAAAIIASIGYDPRSPDSPLAGLGEAGLDALSRVFVDLANMVDVFEPAVFDGDLLHFQATAEPAGIPVDVRAWRAYVSGDIDARRIDCAHGAMTSPGPIAQIGAVLADKLRKHPDAHMNAGEPDEE